MNAESKSALQKIANHFKRRMTNKTHKHCVALSWLEYWVLAYWPKDKTHGKKKKSHDIT